RWRKDLEIKNSASLFPRGIGWSRAPSISTKTRDGQHYFSPRLLRSRFAILDSAWSDTRGKKVGPRSLRAPDVRRSNSTWKTFPPYLSWTFSTFDATGEMCNPAQADLISIPSGDLLWMRQNAADCGLHSGCSSRVPSASQKRLRCRI